MISLGGCLGYLMGHQCPGPLPGQPGGVPLWPAHTHLPRLHGDHTAGDEGSCSGSGGASGKTAGVLWAARCCPCYAHLAFRNLDSLFP